MARDGTGVYNLPAGQPAVTGTTISSTTHNTLANDLATALTQSISKDGQTVPTANLPMGGFRLTGIANAIAVDDAARVSQVQNNAYNLLAAVAGTANAITASVTPKPAAYASGQKFILVPASANTGATTINVSLLGVKNIFWNGAGLIGGELRAGVPVEIEYDGTQFNVTGNSSAIPVGLVTTKGDSLLATGNAAIARKAAPADGYIRMADATQADGWQDVPHMQKNAVINGNFNIWQRGTSFVSPAHNTYQADRWTYQKLTTAATHTVSQSTDVPTVAQAGQLFTSSLLVDCTGADAVVDAADYLAIQQRIEGYNFALLAQRAMVLSFWVKATKTGIYCVSTENGVADRSYVAEYTVNAADTWEKKTVAILASPSAGTWDYSTGVGLYVTFVLMAGANLQTATAGAWQVGDFKATANQVNASDNVANNFRLAGVQLEPGSVATEFERRSFQQELALCQRYYEHVPMTIVSSGVPYVNTGAYKAQKRVAPTLTVVGGTIGTGTVEAITLDGTWGLRQTALATADSDALIAAIAEI